MKRVLCLVSAMNAGGAETFLMKIYRSLDTAQYQMDFCVNTEKEGLYDAEILGRGGKIFHIPSKSESFREFSGQLSRIVRENNYKNVLRVTSNGMGFYDLYVAKKAGAKNCIARSSNSSDGGSFKVKVAHKLGRALYQKYVDVEIAPSDLAAIYTFGEKDYKSGKVTILPNGISFEQYGFSQSERESIRKEFGISDDSFVIGHIGRFMEQKNHKFLMDIFSEVCKTRKNAVLLLIGEGELQSEIREKVKAAGLADKVIFAGVRRDVPSLLSAMDIFLLPSLYEGMPNVLIEAQASGLDCIVSDTITAQAALTSSVERLPLGSAKVWADKTEKVFSGIKPESDDISKIRSSQSLPEEYDIRRVAEKFVSFIV